MSPPNTATCDTPPVDISRGRPVQSANVRKSVIDVLSAVRPTMRTSPKIDDCGPKVGCPTLSGRVSFTAASFSETIWRAR